MSLTRRSPRRPPRRRGRPITDSMNRHRHRPAFILRHQEEIAEDRWPAQGSRITCTRPAESQLLLGGAGPFIGIARRQGGLALSSCQHPLIASPVDRPSAREPQSRLRRGTGCSRVQQTTGPSTFSTSIRVFSGTISPLCVSDIDQVADILDLRRGSSPSAWIITR